MVPSELSLSEILELFPDDDLGLLGNKIAFLFEMLGVPPNVCKGCNERRQWINHAHVWIRKTFEKDLPWGN